MTPTVPAQPLPVPRVGALLVLLLAALLVGGCGSGPAAPAGPTPSEAIRQAATATRDAGSARVALAARTTVAGRPLDVTGDGVVQFVTGAADLGVALPSLGGRVRVVSTGGVVYAMLPPGIGTFLVSGGRPWVSVPLERLGAAGPLAGVGGGLATDPARQLALLQAVRDDARLVGPEPVDATPTTHYAGTVDLDRAAAADPASRPAVEGLKQQAGGPTVPVDVWVDGQGRLRRVALTTGAGGGTTTVTLSDHGTPVSVAAPPADQVNDLGALLPG